MKTKTEYMKRPPKRLGIWMVSLLPLLIAPAFLSAQETKALSLKECVNYALTHSPAIQTSRFDEYIARKQVKEFTGIGLPQIRAGFDFQDFEIIPTMVFNGQEFQFGTRFGAKADATISQLVADGSFFAGIKAAKEYVLLSEKLTERSQLETVIMVTKAYYNALVNIERAEMLTINVNRLDQLLTNTKAFYAAGFVEKIDVSRLEITFENLKVEKIKIDNLLVLMVDLLKFQMGMDVNEGLTLTDTIDKSRFINQVEPELKTFDGINNRIEFQLLEKQYTLQNLNKQRYQNAKFGNLVAYGSIATQAFRSEFDFFQGGDWFNSFLIGFRINVPIFDGLQTHNKVQQINIELSKVDLQREQFKKAVAFEVKSAQIQMLNAWNSMKSMQRNVDLANEVYSVSKTKYEEGVGSNLELIDAESSLRQAESNLLATLYDYVLASIELKKAKGEITLDPSSYSTF